MAQPRSGGGRRVHCALARAPGRARAAGRRQERERARPTGPGYRRVSAGRRPRWWRPVSAPALGKGATTLRSTTRPGKRPRREHAQADQPSRSPEPRSGANRWQRRAKLRRVSQLKRVRCCGHTMSSQAGVTLGVIENRDGTRSAAYGGLKTCGSVWCCPVCAAKIATRRADDLATVMRAVDELGGSARPAVRVPRRAGH